MGRGGGIVGGGGEEEVEGERVGPKDSHNLI